MLSRFKIGHSCWSSMRSQWLSWLSLQQRLPETSSFSRSGCWSNDMNCLTGLCETEILWDRIRGQGSATKRPLQYNCLPEGISIWRISWWSFSWRILLLFWLSWLNGQTLIRSEISFWWLGVPCSGFHKGLKLKLRQKWELQTGLCLPCQESCRALKLFWWWGGGPYPGYLHKCLLCQTNTERSTRWKRRSPLFLLLV